MTKIKKTRNERLEDILVEKQVFWLDRRELVNLEERLNLKCGICFHAWCPTGSSFVVQKKGCPCCAGQKRYSDAEYIERINQIGVQNKFIFIRKFTDNKMRSHTRAVLSCINCKHEWDSILCNILSGKYSCPACAHLGFNPSKRSVLYLLKVLDWDGNLIAYKYGISNSFGKRLENTRSYNPMLSFEAVATWGYYDGKLCREHESGIKSSFKQHLSKEEMPSGFTETISPDSLLDFWNFQNENYLNGG